MKNHPLAFLLCLLAFVPLAQAQVSLSGSGTYVQDFNSLSTGGANLSTVPWTDNSTLPGWFIQPQSGTLNLQVFAGSTNAVGIYSLGTGTTSTDRAVGAQPGTATGAVAFGVLLRNDSGSPLTLGTLTYTGEQYRFSGAANNTHTMWYQISATPITALTPASNAGWTAVPALDFTNPVTTANYVSLGLANPAASLNPNANAAYRTVCSASLADITLAPGEYIMFRLLDADNSGTDHTLGLDDFSLSYSGVSVPAAPAITQQPVDATVALGGNATFTVTATGEPTPLLQWRKGGVDLSGATGSTLSITNAQVSDAGTYDVVATNSVGSVTSTIALLVVNPLLETVGAPAFNPSGGAYTSAQSVSIASTTSGATIRYTTNGTAPNPGVGTIYAGPISLTSNTELRAIAYKDGMADSSVTTATYTISTDGWPAKPGATNTGVPAGVTLTAYAGPNPITVDGTVIDAKEISGTLTIQANNVTIRRSRITGGTYNINAMQNGPYTGLVIEDCELRGAGSAAIYGRNFTATRLNIHDSGGDGIKPRGGVTVTHCWFHHLGTGADAHADGVQAREGGANMLFRYNNFDMPSGANLPPGYHSNSNFILERESGSLPNFVIDRNWLNGGNYTIYVEVSGVSITNNRFGRDQNGPPALRLLNGSPDVWSGNVWEDTGLPVDSSAPFAPVITTQPVSLTVNENGVASFTVAASGLPTPVFQWRKGGAAIPGATNASLVFAHAQSSDGGSYDVLVSNSQGTVTSSPATLTVVPETTVATPVFSPAAGTYAAAQTVTITTPTIGSVIRYTTDGSAPTPTTGAVYSGPIAVAATATLKAAGYRSGLTASAVAEAAYTIDPAAATIVPAGPDFFNQPLPDAQSGVFTVQFDAVPSIAPIDATVSLSSGAQGAYSGLATIVRFSSSGNIDARNGGAYAATSAIPYSAGASYHFRLLVNVPAHTYSVFVTPPGGSELTVGMNYAFRTEQNAVTSLDTWNAAVLATPGGSLAVRNFAVSTAEPPALAAPTITQQPANATASAGASATFTVAATGNPAPTYQWRRGGNDIGGATGETLMLSDVQAADAGSYDVVVSNSQGSVTSGAATLTVTPAVPTGGNVYFVDPASGSMANPGTAASPWSTLQAVFAAGKVFAAGDTIYLRTGDHGFPVITGDNSGDVTITKEAGHDPVINRLDFNGATHWVLDGVKIHTTANPPTPPILVHPVPAIYENSLLRITNASSMIAIKNCTVYSIEDPSSWSADDWNNRAWTGIYMHNDSHHLTIDGCTVKNVNFGIHMNASVHHLTIRNSIVQNFCGDGMRANCSDLTIEDNIIGDAIGSNPGNHYDLIQGFASARVVIRGNLLFDTTSSRPMIASAQGLGAFDGMFDDWIVENNVIAIAHTNALTLLGARNCRIVNNTVVKNPFSSAAVMPAIRVAAHKDGTPSTGNLVRNNLAALLNNESGIGLVDFNVVSTDYTSLFVDYPALDFHLKEGSEAVNAGTSDLAPVVDIEGSPRVVPFDAGAYERQGGVPATEAPVFQPAAGTYVGAQSVILSTPTPGASIRYTTDGSTPTASTGIIYAGPIAVPGNTSIKAVAYHTGGELADSAVRTAAYIINSSTNVTVTGLDGFYTTPLASAQSGSFGVQFDATPSIAPMDAVVGLAFGTPTAYSGLATIVRFSATGVIDAYNGSGYAAASSISYSAGSTYHFRLAVNVSTHTYSVFVTPPGGGELLVGGDFAFRSSQASVTSLQNWVVSVLAASGGSIAVNNFTLDAALAPPAITSQPTSVTAAVGASATFSVAATGNPAPAYQWRKAGVNLPGETSATLAIASVQSDDSGSYDVVVSNSVGSVTSNPVELAVSGVAAGPGVALGASGVYAQNFNTLPASGTLTWSDNETIPGWYVAKQGAGAVMLSAAPGGSATTGLFNLGTALLPGDRALGALPGTNTGGAVAFGVLFRNTTDGVITFDTLGYAGEQYRYSGAANNTNTMWYQISASPITSLTVTDNSGWTPLPSLDFTNPITTANAAGLGLPSPATSLNANIPPFRTEISANVGDIVLAPGEYIMFRLLDIDNGGTDHTLGIDDFSLSYTVALPPAITTQPAGAAATAGATVTLTVVATGEPAPSYQWRKDQVAIEGANGSSLVISAVGFADAGSYDVVVSNSAGSVTSDAAVITVTGPAIRITGAGAYTQNFNSLPASGTITWVNNATLSGWYIEKQGTGAITLSAAPGGSATTGLFNLGTAALPADRALGALPGTNTGGAVAYGVQFYNDSGAPIVLGALGYAGEQYRYSGAANNTHTMWYQISADPIASLTVTNNSDWTPLPSLNFTNPITTANAAGLGLPSPATSLNGNVPPFRTELSASLGDIVLAPGEYIMFRLLDIDNSGTDHTLGIDDFSLGYGVYVSSAPVISTQPVSQTVTPGSSVSFTVEASGVPSVSYQWRKNGTDLSGATGTTLTLAGVSTVDAGSYDVVVTNSVGSTTSEAAMLVVNKLPAEITFSDLSQVYDGNPHVATVVTVPAGLPLAITYEGSATAPTQAGTYSVVATVVDGSYEGMASATFVITKASAGVTLGELSQTYDGTPRAATVTTSPASLAVNVTYTGSATAPTNAGEYAVVAVVDDPNHTGTATGTLVVSQAEATVSLGGLQRRYDGTPKAIVAVTEPEGLTVDITYNGSPVAPTYPGGHAVVATIDDPNYQGSASGELVIEVAALIRHGATLNGDIDGALQILLPENVTLNGASIDGDLLVPGTPALTVNGQALHAGILDGLGAATPASHRITLNGNTVLHYIVRRVDAIPLPVVAAPPAPAGSVDVVLNHANQNVQSWATLRHLTLNGAAGPRVVPPGTYGNLTANGNSGFILGVPGATEPAVYNLQNLTINGSAQVQIAGPVILTLANGVALNGSVGRADQPGLLTLRIASGGLTLNGNVTLSGNVVAPNGTVTLNGNSTLRGTVVADRLTLNGNSILSQPPEEE